MQHVRAESTILCLYGKIRSAKTRILAYLMQWLENWDSNNFPLCESNSLDACFHLLDVYAFCTRNSLIDLICHSNNVMPQFFFYTPWKHQKASGFLMFSRGIERDQWHEIGYCVSLCIQSKCWKKRIRKTPNTDTFYTVLTANFINLVTIFFTIFQITVRVT